MNHHVGSSYNVDNSQSSANYVEIDHIYPMKGQEMSTAVNYAQNHSPIYQNAGDNATANRETTTPIYSNTNSDRYRNHSQGMTYGESLAHHLRHNWGDHTDNAQGILPNEAALGGFTILYSRSIGGTAAASRLVRGLYAARQEVLRRPQHKNNALVTSTGEGGSAYWLAVHSIASLRGLLREVIRKNCFPIREI